VVSEIGLGCMGMSGGYGPSDEREGIASIHSAIDAGVTLLDTGDFYGMGHNEMLISRALASHAIGRERIVLSVKFGGMRDPRGGWGGIDTRPAAMRNFLAYTLQRLKTDYVDVYRPARVDPEVPVEETVGAIAEMVQAGYVRFIGLSEAGAETIRRAQAVHPICDLQIEYSLISRSLEAEILPTCRELGIGITAYGVLSRGLLSGHWRPERTLTENDFRAHAPRFCGENLQRNLALVERLRKVADQAGVSVAQLACGWVLSRGDDVVPLIGARNPAQVQEALGTLSLELDPDLLAQIQAAIPAQAAAGERYPKPQMAHLDSERGAA
jgi:aryl-alcohol dehydrogenase-like predicted oxidoreductase